MRARSLLWIAATWWLLAAWLPATAGDGDRLADIKAQIREEFPDVSQLSTQALERWLSTGARTPLLLDARESAEFAVSHLRDAQLTPSAREALALLADTPKNQLIVAYCSVGYRSAALAQELAARGFTNVYNLEGSLFEWANRGLPCTGTAARSRRFIPTTGGGSASSTRNSTPSRPALEGLHRMVPSPR